PADFVELCEIVAGHMLSLAGAASDPDDGRGRAQRCLASGMALAKLREMIVAQGGRGDVLEDSESLIGNPERIPIPAERDGCVTGIDARRIGLLVRDLKVHAGERKSECGVLLHKKSGELTAGEPVATILAPREASDSFAQASAEVRGAFEIAECAPPRPGVLAAVVTP
ncbi:MAG: pyrimidine-nucleoside phosphorylase, partial [Armatimonadota bacterium]